MSRLNSSQAAQTPAGLLLSKLSRIGASFQHDTALTGKQIGSLESLSEADLTQVKSVGNRLETEVRGALEEIGTQLHADSPRAAEFIKNMHANRAGLEAMSIIMMAGNATKDYRRVAQQHQQAGLEAMGVSNFEMSGYPYAKSAALESFSEVDTDNHVTMSAGYNFSATQQDEFSACFYPVIVGTPDLIYWQVSARRPSITYGARHAANGEKTAYKKANLLDAFRDHKLLENDDTAIVPYFNEANTSDHDLFLGEEFESTVDVCGVPVVTRPLAFGPKLEEGIDLKGLASHPSLIAGGLLTQVDKIDTGSILKNLYLEIGDGTNASVMKLDVSQLMHSQFNQVREGQVEQQELRFVSAKFPLNTVFATDHKNQAIPALAAAKGAGLTLELNLRVDGGLHIETGELDAHVRPVRVVSVIDSAGDAADRAPLANVTFKLIGWDYKGRWKNAGRRTIGLLLDSDEIVRNYYIPTLAPISLQRAVTDETMQRDQEDLLQGTHAWMSNMAVTSILEHAEFLKYHYQEAVRLSNNGRTPDWTGNDRMGVGGLFMAPFFEEAKVDLKEVLNNLTSKDKMADIRGFFAGLINELAYRMVKETGYLPALRAVSGDQKARARLLIGTDIYLPVFMFIPGDDRLTGVELDHEIASSYDERMTGKIILSLGGTGRKDGIDYLNHGNMLYIPELIGTVPMFRGGNTVKETMVQPRFRFINHLPAMAMITVTNVKQAVTERTAIDANTTQVTP